MCEDGEGGAHEDGGRREDKDGANDAQGGGGAVDGATEGEIVAHLAEARHVDGLVEVDDVGAVAFAEDEALHLRVPTVGLVAEVNTRLQQLFHGY